jgi:hypothetical protein
MPRITCLRGVHCQGAVGIAQAGVCYSVTCPAAMCGHASLVGVAFWLSLLPVEMRCRPADCAEMAFHELRAATPRAAGRARADSLRERLQGAAERAVCLLAKQQGRQHLRLRDAPFCRGPPAACCGHTLAWECESFSFLCGLAVKVLAVRVPDTPNPKTRTGAGESRASYRLNV